MKLTIVGCSGSMSGPDSPASCYLLQAKGFDPETGSERLWSVVFDMGPGSFGALWKYLDPRELDAVVFSHAHADHLADVISLYVHHHWHPHSSVPPIAVYGPEGTFERILQIDGWTDPVQGREVFLYEDAHAGSEFSVGPFRITCFQAWHSVPALALRVEGPSEEGSQPVTIGYTGDTDMCDSVIKMAQGVDLLLCEAGFTVNETVRGIHLTGERAGELARQSGVKHLVLTHIQPWTPPQTVEAEARTHWNGELSVAASGKQWVL